MRTIQHEFGVYATCVLGKVSPDSTQFWETRRAFYAGAQAMLGITATLDESVPDEVGAAILEGLAQELEKFGEDVAEGKA